ncbi:ADP-ribosylation factor [Orchesella cincta]|uniref:ADP-ribosylation factor n=1 Tax=Orchesella cincta TaxID=48709 RepID=A0A1D2MJW6_ORCCI|nr:ADP-ribosylation factor [Orchesella cincta]
MGLDSSKLPLPIRKSNFSASTLSLPSLALTKSKKYRKVLILSLDAAGKTTFLYRVKTGQLLNTIPTIGYNHERIEYKSSMFDLWDVGGQDEVRKNWGNYFFNVQAVIFIVDSNDRERMDEVRTELRRVEKFLQQNRRMNAVILILANKQDLPEAMTYHELHSTLFQSRSQKFHWEMRTCCNKTGEGVMEALEWLHKELKRRYRK